ncbi:hypothetical protein FB451DRAFT_454615 [Mycena latifolia]|nr:hypothetical protein FB451DRAFT_454615 [Mycena latifolia]
MPDSWGVRLLSEPTSISHRLVAVYDRKTGAVYPVRSLACVLTLCYLVVPKDIKYNTNVGAPCSSWVAEWLHLLLHWARSRMRFKGLRLSSAVTLMRLGAKSNAVPLGVVAATMTLGSYTAERCGLAPDSLPGLGIQACFSSAAYLSIHQRWPAKKHFWAAELGSTVLIAATMLGIAAWSLVPPNFGRRE